MKYINKETAEEIGALALDFTDHLLFKKTYDVSIGGTTIWRHFEHYKLLCGIQFTEKTTKETKNPKGFHLNVMTNGDVFGRDFPYYDGDLELIPIYNQRKIFEIIQSV